MVTAIQAMANEMRLVLDTYQLQLDTLDLDPFAREPGRSVAPPASSVTITETSVRSRRPLYAAAAGPNQVVSASWSPKSVPPPTQAT